MEYYDVYFVWWFPKDEQVLVKMKLRHNCLNIKNDDELAKK